MLKSSESAEAGFPLQRREPPIDGMREGLAAMQRESNRIDQRLPRPVFPIMSQEDQRRSPRHFLSPEEREQLKIRMQTNQKRRELGTANFQRHFGRMHRLQSIQARSPEFNIVQAVADFELFGTDISNANKKLKDITDPGLRESEKQKRRYFLNLKKAQLRFEKAMVARGEFEKLKKETKDSCWNNNDNNQQQTTM